MSSSMVFTAPSVRVCEQVVEYLRDEGMPDESISVLGNVDNAAENILGGGLLENDA